MSDVNRTRLPDRRPSVTQRVRHTLNGGQTLDVLVTFSIDLDTGKVREVFSADFKAGSDNQTLIVDACILVSLLLQYGRSPALILGSLSEPRSLIGAMLEAAAQVEKDNQGG